MYLVDANIILRYLLDDHAELSSKAADILEQYEVTLPMEVACEVVYVLQKVYGIDRLEIQQQLSQLLSEGLINMEKTDVFLAALTFYSTNKLDFVDTLLWAYHTREDAEVFTFDAKLNKALERH